MLGKDEKKDRTCGRGETCVKEFAFYPENKMCIKGYEAKDRHGHILFLKPAVGLQVGEKSEGQKWGPVETETLEEAVAVNRK